jgi:hypothetical protein
MQSWKGPQISAGVFLGVGADCFDLSAGQRPSSDRTNALTVQANRVYVIEMRLLYPPSLLISQYLCIIGCFCGPVCWLLCRRTTLLREETREAVGFF